MGPGRRSRKYLGRVLQWTVSLALLYVLWRWVLTPHVSVTAIASPHAIWHALRSSYDDGSLWSMVGTTLSEAMVGFAIGAAAGALLAVVTAAAPVLGAFLEPVIVWIYAMPKFVAAPVLFVWFGAGFVPRVIMVVLAVLPVVVIYVVDGLRTVDTAVVRAMRQFGANRRQVARIVLLPYGGRFFFTALAYVLPHALTIAIGAEIVFGTTSGLGGALNSDAQIFDAAGLLAALTVATVISVILVALTRRVEALLLGRSGSALSSTAGAM
jgi:NitT/TauT family transport system permease protein